MTTYTYAEDEGVSTTRSFAIAAVDQKGPTIDKSKPAKLRKRVDFQGNSNAFSAINSAKAMSVSCLVVSL